MSAPVTKEDKARAREWVSRIERAHGTILGGVAYEFDLAVEFAAEREKWWKAGQERMQDRLLPSIGGGSMREKHRSFPVEPLPPPTVTTRKERWEKARKLVCPDADVKGMCEYRKPGGGDGCDYCEVNAETRVARLIARIADAFKEPVA